MPRQRKRQPEQRKAKKRKIAQRPSKAAITRIAKKRPELNPYVLHALLIERDGPRRIFVGAQLELPF
jgi:hypothetical protein